MDTCRQEDEPTLRTFRMRVLLILGLGIATASAVLFLPPVAQDQAYHNFADQRSLLGIPNMLNVISNVPFIVVGALGLMFLLHQGPVRPHGPLLEQSERWPFLVLFAGVGLTGFGSAYYHLAPNNTTLVWDRLPMTVAFMSFFVAVIGERISLKAGQRSLLPLLALGIGSVLYWHVGEVTGHGDLRLYGLVQFFPLLAIPLMLFLFPPRYTRTTDLLAVVGLYGLAKLFELVDAQVFALGRVVSGHTLKHLASAVAGYWILRMLWLRRPVESLRSHPVGAPVGTPTSTSLTCL